MVATTLVLFAQRLPCSFIYVIEGVDFSMRIAFAVDEAFERHVIAMII